MLTRPAFTSSSRGGRAGRAGRAGLASLITRPVGLARNPPQPAPRLTAVPDHAAAPTTSSSSSSPPLPPYDWRSQWYPVAFTADLPLDTPIQAWLFDEPIAVARRGGGRPPVALVDACPHRRAALSEGRVTAGGAIQCAYHGWTFDGATGACQGVPHLVGSGGGVGGGGGGDPAASSGPTTATPTPLSASRTCARALPCVERQGMVWVAPLGPGGGPPPQPSALVGIRELEEEAGGKARRWVTADFVRTFPVDASLILENLCDPDHGLAHQTLSLDVFSGGGPDRKRMALAQGVGRGGGLHLVGSVPATPVLGASTADALKKKAAKAKATAGTGASGTAHPTPSPPPPPTAVLEFEAPGFVRWGRVGADGSPPRFLATFWAVPTRAGHCALFIRYARSFATWLPTPRWLVAVGLLHFLDQDTFLVASQQREVLGGEAKAAMAAVAAGAAGSPTPTPTPTPTPPPPFRRSSLFAYRTPTEVFLAALGKWLDAALPAQPNRSARLLAGAGQGHARREEVLDRWAGHTAFVPSSRAAHARAAAAARVLGVLALVSLAAWVAALTPGGALARARPAVVVAWGAAPALAGVAARASAWLASRFVFCFPREAQVRELAAIAGLAPGVEG